MLSIKLPHLAQWHQQRRANSAVYHDLFQQAGLIGEPVILPEPMYRNASDAGAHDFHIYNQYIIRVPRRDDLREFLQSLLSGLPAQATMSGKIWLWRLILSGGGTGSPRYSGTAHLSRTQ